MSEKIEKTEEEWKKTLTPEQYHVLREKGTERAKHSSETVRLPNYFTRRNIRRSRLSYPLSPI